MNPEEQQKLDRVIAITEETNQIVKKIRQVQKRAAMFKAVYWGIIILGFLGFFVFLMPFFSNIVSLYGGPDVDFSKYQNLLNQLQ